MMSCSVQLASSPLAKPRAKSSSQAVWRAGTRTRLDVLAQLELSLMRDPVHHGPPSKVPFSETCRASGKPSRSAQNKASLK